ncbi:cupredoxin family copper-binding protein [Methanococcus maripaludis]|uniref:Plastocyanin n=2 Tax=Methanococcus maripaludis TaxID=39152 RepID=A0A7J9PFG7_METMI|nr:cupredoxin family copper-binding protein [Methanococcus maripaludis]MBA2862012.1 plastocyanin [Methanococcus maripaludis]
MHKYIAAISIIFTIIFAGCQMESPVDTSTNFEAQNEATVLIEDFSYKPSSITVRVGATVIWIQKDSVRHSVTSNEGVFDSGLLSKGISWNYTFNEAGTYDYYCIPHPYMKGTVEVVE